MITIDEQLLTVREAARLFPGRRGNPINISTIWRWMLDHRRGVQLESIIVGGVRYTSRSAIQRYIERLNPEQAAAPSIRTATQRSRASARAARALERAGI